MTAEILHGLHSYFSFRIGGELFAVNIGQITKILEYTEITKVPNSPPYFKGIINLSGEVIPVFDGRLKLGFQEQERSRETCILILVFARGGITVRSGIIVDSVETVLTLGPESIKPVQTAEKKFNESFVQGIVPCNGGFAALLNLEKIFFEEEKISVVSV